MLDQYEAQRRVLEDTGLPERPDIIQQRTELEAYRATVQQCQEEYVAAMAPIAQAIFARWAASDNRARALIGQAALSGDFRPLATSPFWRYFGGRDDDVWTMPLTPQQPDHPEHETNTPE